MGNDQRKRVAVFTGTRAEFGLLTPIVRELANAEDINLSLIVAGAHLSSLHGMTVSDIEREGFRIDAKVEMLLASDTPAAATKSLGIALIDLATTLDRLAPELLIVLGDRYEVLAAATAATLAGIPIAHLHGGEITEGAFDDSIRHAVTKLSHLHFVATPEFAQRVRQLGEDPSRVFVVGPPSADVIGDLAPIVDQDVEALLGVPVPDDYAIVMYHPSTIPGEDPAKATDEILSACSRVTGLRMLCFLPNADPEYGSVQATITSFVDRHPGATVVSSLPHGVFLSLLRGANVIIGNSSAGIIEAPLLGTPTINVGQRQSGRPRAPSIIDVDPNSSDIYAALLRSRSTEHRQVVALRDSPYATGMSASVAVTSVIRSIDLNDLLRKRFCDI